MEGMETAEAIQREQLERLRDFLGPQVSSEEGHTVRSESRIESPINFRNPRAREFFVDGRSIPDGKCVLVYTSVQSSDTHRAPIVNFDAGPSWSGLLPISNHPNETRKLFFW